jgi:hypothetical protein
MCGKCRKHGQINIQTQPQPEIPKEETALGDIGIDGRIILKWI